MNGNYGTMYADYLQMLSMLNMRSGYPRPRFNIKAKRRQKQFRKSGRR